MRRHHQRESSTRAVPRNCDFIATRYTVIAVLSTLLVCCTSLVNSQVLTTSPPAYNGTLCSFRHGISACTEGFSCELPLLPGLWNTTNPYGSIVDFLGTTPLLDYQQPQNPDSANLTSVYATIQLCRYCRSGTKDSLQYGPCYVLNGTDACTVVVETPIEPVGVCMPCRAGQYCPGIDSATSLETNSSAGYVYDNLCQEGYYCQGFAEQVICPVGYFCPRGSRHPNKCEQPGSWCDVGTIDPTSTCPAGYYCPDPASKILCPKKNYCRESSTEPTQCSFFSYCPAGTAVKFQIWVGIFLAVVMLSLAAILRNGRITIRRYVKKFVRLCWTKKTGLAYLDEDSQAEHTSAPKVPPAIPSSSFHITIRNLYLKKGSNQILNGINLRLRSGVVMIQGTSGCGKSTLIKCLSGKTQNQLTGLEGTITLSDGGSTGNAQKSISSAASNGSKSKYHHSEVEMKTSLNSIENTTVATLSSSLLSNDYQASSSSINKGERSCTFHAFPHSPLNTAYQRQLWSAFQSHTGYVPQDDVVHEDLNVKDNINFAIKLKRAGLTDRQQRELLTEMLTEFQLTRQARNLITNVSGGQRKRVNIAWDRCADPQFLVLDEPTSGLDATTSLTLTQQLLKFCYPMCDDTTSADALAEVRGKSEKLVLMVIHQPRVEIFHAADQVIFMDRGRIVYSGSPLLVTQYFKSDPWLGEVAKVYPVLTSPSAAEADFCMDYVNCMNIYERDGDVNVHSGSTHMAQRWIDTCKKDPRFQDQFIEPIPDRFDDWNQTLQLIPTTRPSGMIQFEALLQRHVKKFSHALEQMSFDIGLIVFAAFAAGLINGSGWAVTDFTGIALMSVVAVGTLGSVVNVRLYGNDRLQTQRELQSGMAPVWYWLSVFLMDLGRLVTYPFIFFVIFYNIIVPASPSIPMYAVYWCVYWCCGGFGQFMSLLASLQTAYLASALLPLIVGSFLNGISPTLTQLKETPLLYVFGSSSYARWACERLVSLELLQMPDYQSPIREILFKRWGFNRNDGSECIATLIAFGVIMRGASILVLVLSTAHIRQKVNAWRTHLRVRFGKLILPTSTTQLLAEYGKVNSSTAIMPNATNHRLSSANDAFHDDDEADASTKISSSSTSTFGSTGSTNINIARIASPSNSDDTDYGDNEDTVSEASDITMTSSEAQKDAAGPRFTPFKVFIIVLTLVFCVGFVYLLVY